MKTKRKEKEKKRRKEKKRSEEKKVLHAQIRTRALRRTGRKLYHKATCNKLCGSFIIKTFEPY